MWLLRRIAIGKASVRKDEATEAIRRIDQAKVNTWNRRLKIETWLEKRRKKYLPKDQQKSEFRCFQKGEDVK